MLKAFDPKALVRHPAAGAAILIACFFGFSYRFFLAETVVPLHDTGLLFQVFKTTYSNHYFTGDLPEWLPHAVYGHHTHLENILRLSPLTYPVMVLGKLLGILDTLVMFKTVILLEIIVLCCGFLLLANELFENRYVALFALAPLLLTTIVINQIYFLFHIVYLMPLMTYYILRFVKSGNIKNIIFTAAISFSALYGNNVYFIIYYFIYSIVALSIFFCVYRKGFRLVFKRVHIPSISLVLLFMGVSILLILTSTDELTFLVPGRDPVTLQVDLDTFLTYGRGGIIKTLEMLLAVPLSTNDVLFYVPSMALIFAVYALFRERDRVFLALTAVFTIMLVLAWGRYSPLAYAIYYIPGVSYFRHIGLMYAFPKVLLCLIAGFGLRRFLTTSAGGEGAFHEERRFLTVISSLTALAVFAVLGITLFITRTLEVNSIRMALVMLSAIGFAIFALTSFLPTLRKQTLLGVWIGVMVLQGGGYLIGINALFSNDYDIDPAVKKEIADARLYPFEETRLAMPNHPKFPLWNAFIQGPYLYQSYMNLYGALGIDPCYPVIPRNRMDVYASSVGTLTHHLFGQDADIRNLGAYYKQSPDALFFRLAGCRPTAKLQLIGSFDERALGPGPPITPEAMASAVMVERPDTGERRLVKSTAGESLSAASLSGQGIAVTHFSANRLEVKVEEVGPKGAWLVYADAFHPGWRAAVDGRPAPVWRANLAFKAVYLPPGTTAAGFDFTPPWRQAAYWFVALFSLAVMVLGCLPGAAHAFMSRRPGA